METTKTKIICCEMLLILVLVLSITSITLAAEDIWIKKEDMPTARILLGTCVVDGKIYAIGGGTRPHVPISVVEVYDPITDTWTRKTDMPSARACLGTSVVNGKIYAIGGGEITEGTKSTFEYDPATDTWTRKADMPTTRCFLTTSVVNGKIYAIGGARATGGGPYLSTVEEYDPATDAWTSKADLPEPRYLHAAGVVDEKIYIIAGGWQPGTASTAVFAYDPTTDTWERKADAPTARCFLSASAVNGKIYVIGGDFGPPKANVEEYDPATDTWTKRADMPSPRGSLSTVALNDKIYVIGGSVTLFNDTLATVEEYYPNPLIVDFNGDGIVNTKEILRLIESWGQADPMCDIAPRPSGDGIVDALDLELLMSFWEQPVDDPTLIAHWALDEAEGDVAYDSAGANDAVVVGGAEWQPGGGQVNGALQLDGIDGCAIAGPILNPANGPFSAFVWINEGMPGQVIISQLNGANWLRVDSASGCLMTELCAWGRNGTPLFSDMEILDGNWHRIGFVWDGLNRSLYVDDILTAGDTQQGLASSIGGLNIGCGMNSAAGTFWFGMIDEVRIYSRAVSP